MIRQDITLGDYTYIVDLYKNSDNVTKQYAILRKYDVVNNIVYDSDIYFIEIDILNKCKQYDEQGYFTGYFDLNKLKDEIVYPISYNDYTGYSNNYSDFNDTYIESCFGYDNDIYKIYNDTISETANIPCDKVRIYFPIINSKLNAIIHINNFINDVRYHYICRLANKYDVNSENELTINNIKYSEFIDIYIPNIEKLFSSNEYFILNNNTVNDFNYDFTVIDSNDKTIKILPKITSIIEDHEFKIKFTYSLQTVNNPVNIFKIIYNNSFNIYVTGFKTFTINKSGCNINNIELESVIYNLFANIKYPSKHINNIYPSINVTEYVNIYVIQVNCILKLDYMYTSINNLNNSVNIDDYTDIINEFNDYDYLSLLSEYSANYNDNISTVITYNFDQILDNIISKISIKFINREFDIDIPIKYKNNLQYNSLSSLIVPYMINASNDETKKIFVNLNKSIENRYLNEPIVITLFPTSDIDDNNHTYVLDKNLEPNSDEFVNNVFFKLSSKLGFDNGIISILNTFEFPDNIYNNIHDAYYKYNNVSQINYIEYTNNDDYDDEENNIESGITACGYHIEIASDINFTKVFYKLDINSSNKENIIYDFAFQLNNIFTSWYNLPEIIVIRTYFIDKLLNNVIIGNDVVVTNEWFKYFINDKEEYRISNIHQLTADPNSVKTFENTDMNLSYFNFIDKINCTINKSETSNSISSVSNTPKILYKPVFYKVADLQTIKIKRSLTQNVGINLVDYMTKVDTFKLIIDDLEFIEYARNDMYVIFNVTASKIENTSGRYSILNQDNEYISDGDWYIY